MSRGSDMVLLRFLASLRLGCTGVSRTQIGQGICGHLEMPANLDLERVEHLAVFLRRSQGPLPEQRRQVMDVPAQDRKFGTGGGQRGQMVLASRQDSPAADQP